MCLLPVLCVKNFALRNEFDNVVGNSFTTSVDCVLV